MQNSAIDYWLNSSWLVGENYSYLEQLYDKFITDPHSVDTGWCSTFEKFVTDNSINASDSITTQSSIPYTNVKIYQLINAFRCWGHRYANLDPLGMSKKINITELDPAYYNLNKNSWQEEISVSLSPSDKKILKFNEFYKILNQIYCGTIGIEYMHITNLEERDWIQQRIEYPEKYNQFSNEEKKIFLKELTAAEGIEKYLGVKFPGAKRFSLEGGDVLIPMLREIIRNANKNGTKELVIGMAHRGRLNVLINICGKNPQDLFDEFTGKYKNHLGTGDVKYHMGFSSNIEIEGSLMHLALAFNPSHLEIVVPVIMGSVRALIDHSSESTNSILPITIHGDAAITGQGVIQETLNMSQTRGYQVGGTIRIIINNQIGFTTSNLQDARSTVYCTDIAKMIQSPIFHVNADDTEAAIFVVKLALDYRNTFKRDVFIDLVCYRRHGHNEADEPRVTQPLMYKKIQQHPTVREIYSAYLENKKIITHDESMAMISNYRNSLDKGKCILPEVHSTNLISRNWLPYLKNNWCEEYPQKIDIDHLKYLSRSICQVPKHIKLQERVDKIYQNRQDMAEGIQPFDWGAAENLAYATLIDAGISIRFSGEDSGRGTFFHRHAVLHNQNDGSTYIPLNHIDGKKGYFNIWDSVLSEESVLAFEYGYSTTEPQKLVIWEAQFGDFSNGAQVVIDQFISSGEQKWGQLSGLVMLLPHGYEGQGPEHSSARLERYLQLCAEQNMQICVPSTPAQIYHLLRRQVLRNMRYPLIVMSPKSLLRHPLATSTIYELANGNFSLIIDEIDNFNIENVKRVIFCSGKVYYDLLEERRKNKKNNIAILRIEQLYPFPYTLAEQILKKYSGVKDFIWCQEEPLNQGAWNYSRQYFQKMIPSNTSLRYICRPESAAPAVGYISLHLKQQKNLISEALNID
ncbi:2-oxoglutarate dehydrogenase E1 component [Candidatus Ishikawella capsulata]|uniref:oxoglutarate dehydrogenase (succinyl-transferring) n=1 Tax=Candidatus Ishikawaella capsulata Mpkobe TaxID=476281 RepID=C5WDD0_9ENTR|nr:2-oxoglutarate dehydrogenase E1 component [Candidatus Ishikawaella capsulata]BAH83336.1 alpha-ketoglutarate decarboxylase [Candidatus Ishikawaella capsulata Mpkobe]